MANVAVYNMNGEQTGSMELKDSIFGIEVKEHVLHMAVVHYLANQRQGTKAAKTRAEVRGGGRKPWRQKGTGRARQGSIRSPQWTGGGVVFAPKPRDFSFKMNRKMKQQALKAALTTKVKENKLIVLEDLKLDQIKTKEMKKVVENLKVEKALIVVENNEKKRNIYLSAKNLPNVFAIGVNTINVYDILKYDTFVITKEAVEAIQEVYA